MIERLKRVPIVFLFALSLLGAFPANAALPQLAEGGSRPSLAPMLKQAVPGVVNISTKSRVTVQQSPLFRDPFFRRLFDIPEQAPRERESQSLGSGVVVDGDQGYMGLNPMRAAMVDDLAHS